MVLPLSLGFHSWRWGRGLGHGEGVLEDRLGFYRVRRREKKWMEEREVWGQCMKKGESVWQRGTVQIFLRSLAISRQPLNISPSGSALAAESLIWGAPYLRGSLHLVTDRQVLQRPTHFCSLMDNYNSNSLQHCQLSCWKLCQAYIKDEFLPLLPLPYKSVNHNKYLASQTVSASASGEPGLYQESFERAKVDKTGFRARSLTAQTGDKDSISGAQIISVINFHW